MTLEVFTDKFTDLSVSNRVAIFNEFCLEYGNSDNMLYSFEYIVPMLAPQEHCTNAHFVRT